MRFLKVIFSTIIVLLGIVFIIENLEVLKQPVTLRLDLYLAHLESPAVPPLGAGALLFLPGGLHRLTLRHLRGGRPAPDHPPAQA